MSERYPTSELRSGWVEEIEAVAPDLDLSDVVGADFAAVSFAATGGTAPRDLADRFGAILQPEDFGAVGDGTTDDTEAFQALIDYLDAQSTQGGVIQLSRKKYLLNDQLLITTDGITIRGQGNADIWFPSGWGGAPSELCFDHTDGPGIRISKGNSITLEHLRISSGTTRSANTTVTGNHGIWVESIEDTGATAERQNYIRLIDIHVMDQPGHGIVFAGDNIGVYVETWSTVGNGGHGFVYDNGNSTGRTNTARPGICTLVNGRSHDNVGHGLCVGHPDSGFEVPYRVMVFNLDSFRNANTAGVRHNNHNWYFAAENSVAMCNGTGGANQTDPNITGGVFLAGTHVSLIHHRFINNDVPLTIGELTGGETNGVEVIHPYCDSDIDRPDLVVFETGPRNVRLVVPKQSDFTNVTSTSSNVTGRVQIEYNNTMSDTGTHSSLAVSGAFDVTLTGGDTDIDVTANDTSVTGQLAILQSGTGDAAVRMTAGGTPWIVGVDNSSSDRFGIQQATSLGTGAQFVITTAGSVGIGEVSPDYKLDVNGSLGFTPGASVTPVDNGDVVFELTNNTTLTIKAKGSDGTVRSGTVTLA
jgi:hypothetical protein